MNDRLYKLIEKTNRTEKAHFQKFGFKSTDGGKHERELFDIIVEGQRKDVKDLDAYVRKAYSNKNRTDFVRMRARLFDAVLSSISDHGRSEQDAYHFSQILLNSRTLFERGFFKEARKRLKKGSKMASKQQKPHWQLVLGKELSTLETRHGTHQSILDAIDDQLRSLKNSEQLTLLAKYYEMAFHLQRTIGQQREDKEMLTDKLLDIEQSADKLDLSDAPPATRFNRIMLRQVVAHTLSNTDAALRHTEDAFQLIRTHPEMTKGRQQMPVSLLSNLINDALAAFQFEYYHRYMDELRNWPVTDEKVKRYAEGQVLRCEGNAALYFAEFHRWKPLLLQLQQLGIDQLLPHVRWALFGQLVHMMFADLTIRPCIKEINTLLHETKDQKRQDLQTNLELLLATCHYELEKLSTVEQLIDSIKTRITLKEQFTASETIFINTLEKLITAPSVARAEIFAVAANELNSKPDNRPVGFFNPSVWILAKWKRKTYAEMLKVHYRIGGRE
jgi:hypothetical protein